MKENYEDMVHNICVNEEKKRKSDEIDQIFEENDKELYNNYNGYNDNNDIHSFIANVLLYL
jgi:hypothetical protein